MRAMTATLFKIAAFVNMASLRSTGQLGGTFKMAGSPAVIGLAFKNCVSEH